jgi:hypothetical protein
MRIPELFVVVLYGFNYRQILVCGVLMYERFLLMCWKLQADLDFLDFALVQLEILRHILGLCSNFLFTAVDIDV